MGVHTIHVVPAIHNEASGPSYSVRRLSESLINEGLDVTLAALDWAPIESPPPFMKTFPLGLGPRRLGRSPKMHHWLKQRVQSRKVDIIHNHGMWQMNAVYPGWAAKCGKTQLVVSPRGAFSQWAMQHGFKGKRLFWLWVQKSSLNAAACFHATGHAEYEDIRRLGFKQPVSVVPNGVDIPDLKVMPSRAIRDLLFISRIHPKKGIHNLLHTWRVVQDRFADWQLVIAGPDDGNYLAQMKTLAAELGLKRCDFPGPLYGEDKLRAYTQADLYVLPTHSENFGMTVAEALAMGTPAIVTKGAPWAGLEREDAGWWIDIGIEPLVSCLTDALSRPVSDLQAMGMRGRRWMEAEFAWASVGKDMADTYKWLLDKSRQRPECIYLN